MDSGSKFEDLMGRAVTLHNQGDYKGALENNLEAYELASDGSIDKGRAARDCAAQYDRMHDTGAAQHWATLAFDIHNQSVLAAQNTEAINTNQAHCALRERAASAMYVGIVGLRKVISNELANGAQDPTDKLIPLGFVRQSWNDLSSAQILQGANPQIDQYQINAIRRVSIAESLHGNRKRALKLGASAVILAFKSESPKLDTATPKLSDKQRYKAKMKALAGGILALTVNGLASPKLNKRRKLALRVADYSL